MDTVFSLLSTVFVFIFLWSFVIARGGRLYVCSLNLLWGIGTWLWPALRRVALGEQEMTTLLLPLVIALMWAITYRVFVPRLGDRHREYTALATWIAMSIMLLLGHPLAAVVMLMVADPSDLLEAMRIPRHAAVPVLVFQFWVVYFTLGWGAGREVTTMSGYISLTMVGVLFFVLREGKAAAGEPVAS